MTKSKLKAIEGQDQMKVNIRRQWGEDGPLYGPIFLHNRYQIARPMLHITHG